MTDNCLERVVQIVHKTDSYVIVNKPYDVYINSNDESIQDTVAKQLVQMLPEFVDNSVSFGFRFVNRLDYATSGLLCIALNKNAASQAGKLFQGNHVTKKYIALVSLRVYDSIVNV